MHMHTHKHTPVSCHDVPSASRFSLSSHLSSLHPSHILLLHHISSVHFFSIVQSLCFFQFLSRCPPLSLPPSVTPISPDSLTSSVLCGLPRPSTCSSRRQLYVSSSFRRSEQVSPQVLHTLTQRAVEENLPTPHDHSDRALQHF